MTGSAAPAATQGAARAAVVVLTYQAARFVDGCFGSLRRMDRGGLEVEVIAVDNGSSDGTPRLVRERFPEVAVVENGANLGFAGGNDVGIRLALERGCEFVYLLNPDTEVEPGFLREAVAVARARPEAAAVQSLLLLASDPGLVNTAGNEIHVLGFGYCGSYRQPASSVPAEPREIAFASGASSLYRATALREVGLLDEALFLYHEDLDLGWRLRLAGWRSLLAPRSLVRHHYEFSRSPRKYYFMERNRYLVLMKNVRLRNLALLAPVLLAAEMGLLLLAAAEGWLPQKLRADRDAFRPSSLRRIREERRRVAALRRASDREVFALFTPKVEFEGAAPGWLQALANRTLSLLWKVLRPLIG